MPRIMQPALLAGLLIGLLSSIPVIQAANNCCGAWLFAGGLLAAYLLQQAQTAPIDAADGALVGLVAGLIGFVVSLVISLLMYWGLGWLGPDDLENVADLLGGACGSERGARASVSRGTVLAFRLFLAFVLSLIVPPLGGLLGAALFKSEPVEGPPPAERPS